MEEIGNFILIFLLGALDSLEFTGINGPPFYVRAANMCKEHGITANVIGIRGDNLNMNIIGKLADITQGDTDIGTFYVYTFFVIEFSL